MGVVYRAEDEKLRRAVALKLLPEASDDAERRQRFLREARSAAAITHPNVAVVHAVDEADGRIYIAMELVEGESLRRRIDRGPLDPSAALDLAVQIARGLAAAHDKGIVHRDLKPENVMITPSGAVKLLDFGLAKSTDELRPVPGSTEPELAKTETLVTAGDGRVMGTPEYMSPEQALGGPLDVRSDVFSFGIVLYEMLSGARPFAGDSTGAVLVAIARDPATPVRERAPHVDERTGDLVMRCLAKQREARFANAGEVLAALAGAAPAKGSTRSTMDLTARPGTAGPTRVARLGVAVGLIAAVGVAGAWVFRRTVTADASLRSASSVGSPPSPQSSATRFVDLAPSPGDPRAMARYREAMDLLGRGERGAGTKALDEAMTIDPGLASAHLQRFLLATLLCPTDLAVARPQFQAASHARSTLSERDREVLDAMAPAVLDPPDLGEVAVRTRALAGKRPDDVQVVELLAVAENKLFHFDASAAAVRRAMALDPSEATPDDPLILAQDLDSDESRRVLDDCVRRFPAADACRAERSARLLCAGSCTELEGEARAMMTLDPDVAIGPYLLVAALAGSGAPTDALRLGLADAHARLSTDVARRNTIRDDARLAAWDGDFTAAITLLDSTQVATQPPLALLRVQLLRESGDRTGAGEAALAYLKGAPALPRFERPESDPLPAMLAYARAGGALSSAEFRARRDAWIESWRKRLDDEGWKAAAPVIWAEAFAHPPTEADARDAVERLPSFGATLPRIASRRFWTDDGPFGELLLLGGRVEDALPRLKTGAARCELGIGPIQARLRLGEALEDTGDRDGACAAYGLVLARWGQAKPRSVTADEARTHAKKLGCALDPGTTPTK